MRIKWMLAATVLALSVASSLFYGLRQLHAGPGQHIVLADANQIMSALIYVAQSEGYFDREGIEIEYQHFSTGKDALKSVLDGKADVAAVADTPVSNALIASRPIAVFAAIQTSDKYEMVFTRSDSGVRTPADLAGKRVGVISGTSADYLLRLFLADKGLSNTGIILVSVAADQAAKELNSGSIDALAAWAPIRGQVEKTDSHMVTFDTTGLYIEAWLLTSRPEFVATHSDAVQRMLRALLAAEQFTVANRGQAVEIIAHHLGMNIADVDDLWDSFGFSVRLDQALLVNIENQIRFNLAGRAETPYPDVLGAIFIKDLAAVDGSRVTVIH